ncbi:MAG: bifunctional phosphoglucose/phosphomannose isomerase [Candidatus Krumholzibacteria bacterium]|nr:bifunctional phosphoglucose/phosphomannose isomerase [Candidatus Krumholzibacteria bacterium]
MNDGLDSGTRFMFGLVGELGEQIRKSAHLDGLAEVEPPATGFGRIILCGMGGSAIAGDLIQPLLADGRIPLTVWRDYGLPHWAGPGDLVLCSSYSGDTEETLSGAHEAGSRGCDRLAITSGGSLASLASAEGFPAVILPGGLPPRASLGLGLGALARCLGRLGLVAEVDTSLVQAAETLDRYRDSRSFPVAPDVRDTGSVPADPEGNPSAAELAEILVGKVPVIYTVGAEAHAAGLRLKAQLNENSKAPACLAQFPELNHNDLVGWSLDTSDRGRFVLLIMRGRSDNDRIRRRVELTRQLLADEFPEIHEIQSSAPGVLDRILSLVQYGDYLSCHLARLKNVDPLPVDRITRLKESLGKPE